MLHICLQNALADPWVAHTELLRRQPSKNNHLWLTKPFILSKAFKAATKQFHVQLVSQKFDLARNDEREKLAGYTCESLNDVFVRQVLLKSHDKLLGFGRVIIPRTTYQAYEKSIQQVGTSAFGEAFLYSNPDCSRGPFEYSFFEFKHETCYWARRSAFTLKGMPLLITEILMNDLPDYPVAHYDQATLSCL